MIIDITLALTPESKTTSNLTLMPIQTKIPILDKTDNNKGILVSIEICRITNPT